jgi:hypothetical protein
MFIALIALIAKTDINLIKLEKGELDENKAVKLIVINNGVIHQWKANS